MDAEAAAMVPVATSPRPPAALIAAIVRQHNRRLFRVARSILKDAAEAEEAVQDAYLRAFIHFDALRDANSLASWLVRITMNEALGRLRRRRDAASLDELAEDAAGEAIALPGWLWQPGPEEAAMQAELRTVLEHAIDNLPTPFRMVIVACDVEQMTMEEASAALGVYATTVRTRLFRARRLLRRMLGTELASALPAAYPCAGARCDRIVTSVLSRLALPPATDRSRPDQEETP